MRRKQLAFRQKNFPELYENALTKLAEKGKRKSGRDWTIKSWLPGTVCSSKALPIAIAH